MDELSDAVRRRDRAGEHMVELNRISRRFMDAEMTLAMEQVQINPEPDVPFVFGRPDNPVPERVAILAGDIIQDLRAALDYLVYQLAKLGTGSFQEGTQFPIEDREDSFRNRANQAAKRGVYLRGVRPEHIAAIEQLQPYKGCNWTAILRDLSNEDKHRRLGLYVQNTGIQTEFSVDPADAADIVIEGGQMTTVGKGIPYSVNMKFLVSLFISFADGSDVQDTLRQLFAEVGNVLEQFKAEF
jgi:hypothetical protein